MIDLTFTYLAVSQTAEFEWVSVTQAMHGQNTPNTGYDYEHSVLRGSGVPVYHPTWSCQSFLCQLRKELQLKINSLVNAAHCRPGKQHPFCSWTQFQVLVSVAPRLNLLHLNVGHSIRLYFNSYGSFKHHPVSAGSVIVGKTKFSHSCLHSQVFACETYMYVVQLVQSLSQHMCVCVFLAVGMHFSSEWI